MSRSNKSESESESDIEGSDQSDSASLGLGSDSDPGSDSSSDSPVVKKKKKTPKKEESSSESDTPEKKKKPAPKKTPKKEESSSESDTPKKKKPAKKPVKKAPKKAPKKEEESSEKEKSDNEEETKELKSPPIPKILKDPIGLESKIIKTEPVAAPKEKKKFTRKPKKMDTVVRGSLSNVIIKNPDDYKKLTAKLTATEAKSVVAKLDSFFTLDKKENKTKKLKVPSVPLLTAIQRQPGESDYNFAVRKAVAVALSKRLIKKSPTENIALANMLMNKIVYNVTYNTDIESGLKKFEKKIVDILPALLKNINTEITDEQEVEEKSSDNDKPSPKESSDNEEDTPPTDSPAIKKTRKPKVIESDDEKSDTEDKSPSKTKKSAWVISLMKGDAYVPGVLDVAFSLRQVKTKHQIVCMVTADVSDDAKEAIKTLVDRIVVVDYLSNATRMKSAKQIEMYSAWMNDSFTIWRSLGLTDYSKVIVVHSDMQFVQNCDDLFDMQAPAACFSLPYLAPYGDRNIPNFYLDQLNKEKKTKWVDIPHNTLIPMKMVKEGLTEAANTVISAITVLEPSIEAMEAMEKIVRNNGKEFEFFENMTLSAPDEIAIAKLSIKMKWDWHHIHQQYEMLARKSDWLPKGMEVKAYHFMGTNAWEQNRTEWPDLEVWWKHVDKLLELHPELRKWFYGDGTATSTDIQYVQWRLTRDLRNYLESKTDRKKLNKIEADNILERWLISMLNTEDIEKKDEKTEDIDRSDEKDLDKSKKTPWTIYKDLPYDHPINIKLLSEIKENLKLTSGKAEAAVKQILLIVKGRLSKTPLTTGQVPKVTDEFVSFGSRFRTPTTKRIKQLKESKQHSDKDIVDMVIGHHVIISGGQQWGYSQKHFNKLYKYGVRSQCFASPVNDRFYGKEGTNYCSAMEIDKKFGSLGNFFKIDLKLIHNLSNMNPPFIEGILDKGISRAFEMLSSDEKKEEKKVFFHGPGWDGSKEDFPIADFYIKLNEYPENKKVVIKLKGGSYVIEDADGNQLKPRIPMVYACLSSTVLSDEERVVITELLNSVKE